MKSEPSKKDKPEGGRPSVTEMMQETWSLQRDMLRELMTGFRRLEHSQQEVQRQLEARLARTDEDTVIGKQDFVSMPDHPGELSLLFNIGNELQMQILLQLSGLYLHQFFLGYEAR